MNMNKQKLIDAVASAVGTSKSAAGETIDAFVAAVSRITRGADSRR
jgi:DNA-binding protein HU-beta